MNLNAAGTVHAEADVYTRKDGAKNGMRGK